MSKFKATEKTNLNNNIEHVCAICCKIRTKKDNQWKNKRVIDSEMLELNLVPNYNDNIHVICGGCYLNKILPQLKLIIKLGKKNLTAKYVENADKNKYKIYSEKLVGERVEENIKTTLNVLQIKNYSKQSPPKRKNEQLEPTNVIVNAKVLKNLLVEHLVLIVKLQN